MDDDKISVISIEYVSANKSNKENKIYKEEVQEHNEISPWNICHVFSVLSICVVFLVPITLVPRTNSIFYQSAWYEFNFCISVLMVLTTANNVLNMVTFFKENSLLSFWIMLKIYLSFMVAWLVPYLSAYLVWCQHLNYYWPIPFLGHNYVLSVVARPAALWISIPRKLRGKKGFQKDFKMYILDTVATVAFGILREVMSVLFKILPDYLQWIIAFLIPLLRMSETSVRSRLVNKMTGGQEEASHVLLELAINAMYSFFVAVRLPDAEITTVFFIIAIEHFLLMQLSYKIVQRHNMVNNESTENNNREKQRMVTEMVLAELTEGMAPIVYAIGISMAYFGSNSTIIGDVKASYWGYKPIDDIGYFLGMMTLLFGVDILSTMMNSLTLSILTNVNISYEFYRIIKRYWHFIAVKFTLNMFMFLATKDINVGMDKTGEYNWITTDGRIQMINGSTDLSYEEKFLLLNECVYC